MISNSICNSLVTNKYMPAICIFAYKRPTHLKRVLDALAANPLAAGLPLIVFVDGPRGEADQAAVAEVVAAAHQAKGFLSVEVRPNPENLGLYRSLTGGISEILAEYESIIVLEDDILTSPYFLQFMLDGMELYQDSPEVGSITGYTPPITQGLPETFFLRGADCWGWATWRDRWALYRHDAKAMAREIRDRGLAREFDLLGHYPYLAMLEGRAAGKNNSWAICWHASCFLAGKLILYPGKSLISNIGLDNSGEHCGPSALMSTKIVDEHSIKVQSIPQVVDPGIFNIYSSHFIVTNQVMNRVISLFLMVTKRIVRFFLPNAKSQLRLTGPYLSYEAALAHSSGYDSPLILAMVKQAVVEVLEGRSAYERDGTAFATMPQRLKLRELLLKYLSPTANVVDFGGGLGGTFINNRDLVSVGQHWAVIEQPTFVTAGQELAHDYGLQVEFHSNFLAPSTPIDLLILSSVLPYLQSPYEILKQALKLAPKLILIDRTAFIDHGEEVWWVQDEHCYYGTPISYPISPLLEKRVLASLKGYEIVDRWLNPFDPQQPAHRGLLLSRCA